MSLIQKIVRFARFSHHTLYWPAVPARPIVVDLGGNKGGFSKELALACDPQGIIVEAHPKLAAMIQPPSGMSVLNAAIGGQDGTTRLSISSQEDCHRVGQPLNGTVLESVEIPSIAPASLLSQFKINTIDILKIDIEGSEIELFEAMTDNQLEKITQATVEFHNAFGAYDESAANQIVERLRDLGFYCFDFVGARYADCLFLNVERCRLTKMELWYLRNVSQRLMWRVPLDVKKLVPLAR